MKRLCMIRKIFFMVLSIVIVLGFMAAPAIGQDKYPSRAITWSVGYAAGGVSDIATRAFTKSVEKILKRPIAVVNKPGAGGAIHLNFLKNSPPDGYTLGSFGSGGMIQTHLRELPYDTFRDFTHLARFGSFLFGIAVNPDSPWKTLKELVQYAKQNPGKLKYASYPPGTPGNLVAESFALYNGFKWKLVAYAGDTLAGTALMGKFVDAAVITYNGWGPFTKAGRLRLLAVFYDKRWKEFPDVPTVKELGYKYTVGLDSLSAAGPKNLPPDVIETLLSAFRKAFKDPEFLTTMENIASPPVYIEGEEFVRYLKNLDQESVKLMKMLGYKLIKE